MSGIYIPGIAFPKDREIRLRIDEKGEVYVYGTYPAELHEAIPVPDHGRLIDESKVLDIVFERCPDDDGSVSKDGDLREMLDEIEALPTIIPADKE